MLENAAFKEHLADWLFNNLLLALVLPCGCAVLLGFIFARLTWLRAVRDFQVCLYSTGLIGSALYDLDVAGRHTSRYSYSGLIILLIVSCMFAAATLIAGHLDKTHPLSPRQEKILVIVSLCTAGFSLLVVLMTRVHEGLL